MLRLQQLKALSIVGALVVLTMASQAYPCCPIQKNDTQQASLEGKKIPALTFEDAKGKAIALDTLQGKVVVLNFWSGGILDADGQIPELGQLQEQWGIDKVQVVGIAMNDRAKKAVHAWMEEEGVDCGMLVGDEKVGEECGLSEWPVTLIVAPNGIIAKQYEGEVEIDQLKEQVKVLLSS